MVNTICECAPRAPILKEKEANENLRLRSMGGSQKAAVG